MAAFQDGACIALCDSVLVHRDPAAAKAIGPHNGRRIVRALEVGDLTGEPFSAGLAARARPLPQPRLRRLAAAHAARARRRPGLSPAHSEGPSMAASHTSFFPSFKDNPVAAYASAIAVAIGLALTSSGDDPQPESSVM